MKKMKKVFAMALALVMVFALVACGGNKAGGENKYGTIEAGKLIVATSPDYAPYEFYALDAEGNPSLAGFDMALAAYIAKELGLELEIVPMDFNGILGEMAAGTADLAIAGLSPDPDRQTAMDFSDIYYEGKQAFVTIKANADKFTDLASTNSAEFSVAAQTGTIQEELAAQFSPDADYISLPKATDIIAELLAGQLDGAYIEWDVAVAYQANYPDLVIVCEVPYEAEGNVIGVAKGNAALLEAVNAALHKCVDSGTFAQYVAEALELAAGATANYVEGEGIVPNE
jgi:polar amino acid transport system substrate-binding protein